MNKDPLASQHLATHFARIAAPGTGRTAYQLTEGPRYAQALYYFIPSMTNDGRWLICQRYDVEEDAITRTTWEALDLLTGERRELAERLPTPDLPNPTEAPVFNTPRMELIYCAGRSYRAVQIHSGEDRHLFDLPADRVACSQNCVSPCGRYFFYLSHDAKQLELIKTQGKRPMTDARVMRYDLDTGEHHLVVRVNGYSKHIIPYGPRHLFFSYDHLPVEHMLLLTDYEGGWYTALRTQDVLGLNTCHYNATRQGLHYEAGGGGHPPRGGVTCPRTHRRVEFPTPVTKSRHVAAVPRGDRWMTDGMEEGGRVLFTLRELSPSGEPSWQLLSGPWPTFGTAQKSHGHPRVTPCGRWVLLLGGDPASGTNQLFLLDIQDVPPSRGLPDYAGDAGMDYPV